MKNFKEVIIIFDSGIGGLSYFKYIKSRIGGCQYVYVADNKNFPYGEKKSWISSRSSFVFDWEA